MPTHVVKIKHYSVPTINVDTISILATGIKTLV